jgi:hypothetical protein
MSQVPTLCGSFSFVRHSSVQATDGDNKVQHPNRFFSLSCLGFFVSRHYASTYIYNNLSSSHILFMARSLERRNADV